MALPQLLNSICRILIQVYFYHKYVFNTQSTTFARDLFGTFRVLNVHFCSFQFWCSFFLTSACARALHMTTQLTASQWTAKMTSKRQEQVKLIEKLSKKKDKDSCCHCTYRYAIQSQGYRGFLNKIRSCAVLWTVVLHPQFHT